MDYRIWLFIITVLLLAGAIGFIEMLRQAKKLKIVSEEFFIDEEDRNNPVRIVFLSDIHISRLPIHWDYIGTMVSKQNPDLILLAGDLVYDPKDGPDISHMAITIIKSRLSMTMKRKNFLPGRLKA